MKYAVVAAAGALTRTPRNAIGLREDPIILGCATDSNFTTWYKNKQYSYNFSAPIIVGAGCTPTDDDFTTTADSNDTHCSLVVQGTNKTRLGDLYFCYDELEAAQAVVIIVGKHSIL